MTIIIGGHEQGLLDGSATILKRNERTGSGGLVAGDELYTNVSNGNLILQERDTFLASQGVDLALVRTYNSRGQFPAKESENENGGWTFSTEVNLERHTDQFVTGEKFDGYTVTYGDGSVFRFVFDAKLGYWVSTDGAGAFETLKVAKNPGANVPDFVITRGDRSQYQFDQAKRLVAVIDRNGVRTSYLYQGDRLTKMVDAGGHALSFVYQGKRLIKVLDERNILLVQYGYGGDEGDDAGSGRLMSVTDRAGLVTRYSYNDDGTLASVELPREQIINGVKQTFDARKLSFKYQAVPVETVPGDDDEHGKKAMALTELIDASGAVTTFEYDFQFSSTMAPDDRDVRFKVKSGDDDKPRFFVGGTSLVVNALGNARATSNAPESVAWRRANGYYATYDARAIDKSAALKAQYDAIRAAQSLSYRYDADGYITQVTDALGFRTSYTYDLKDNLTSVRTGSAAVHAANAAAATDRLAPQAIDIAAAIPTATQNLTYEYDTNGNVSAMIDGDGNRTTYTYTARNLVAGQTAGMGSALATLDDLSPGDGYYRAKRVALGFVDAPAALLSTAQKDAIRALYTTSYTYDVADKLITRVDPGGDRTDFQYNVQGKLTRRIVYLDATDLVTPAKQQVTNYAYDAFGNNVSITDAQGGVTTRSFDQFGNVLTVTDPKGGVTTYTYDGDNRLLSRADQLGHSTAFAYDPVGNLIAVTDANGHTITQIFDLSNRLIASLESSLSGPAQDRRASYQYDVFGNRTAVTDANGNTTTYSYDAKNQLIDLATAQALDGAEQLVKYHEHFSYDALGNVLTHTDRNGNVSAQTYTTAGLLKSYTDNSGNVTEYLYDADQQAVRVTLGAQLAPALQKLLRFGYDEEDQMTSETDALGATHRTQYDAVGNIVAQINENGQQTNFEYDRNNHLLKEIRPQVIDPVSGQPTRYTVLHQYDANGNQVTITDENGHTSAYAFDKGNRLVLVTDANGVKTVYGYDSRDHRTLIAIGAQAHQDAAGNVVIDSVNDAAVSTSVYDEFNQLVSETDALGNALASSDLGVYQSLRTELGYAAATANLSAADKAALRARFATRYSYDRVGNQTSVTDHLGRITRKTYDALNRLQSLTEAEGLPLQRTTSYRRDGNDNLVKSTDALGRVTTFTYDRMDRHVDTTDTLGAVTRQEYDNTGNLTARTQAFGTVEARTTRYVYDLNNRLTAKTDPQSFTERYEYDAVGNRLKVTDARGSVSQFVYDALDRNIKVIDPRGFETRYEYDAVGNRITLTDAKGGIQRIQYDGVNRYVQTTDAEGRVTRFAYDVLGNTVEQTTAFGTAQAQVTRYVYDAQGHLRQVTDALGKVSTRGYDAEYNYVSTTDGNGHTTRFGFDALNRQITVIDALGGTTIYAYDTVDNKLSETDPLGHIRSFQYDANDRQIVQTDALGVQTRYGYDRLGNQVSVTGAANTPLASTTTFTYDSNNRLIRHADALSGVTTYAYDGNGNLVRSVDENGHATAYAYNANNQVSSITDAQGAVTSYSYDANGNRVQVTTQASTQQVQTSYVNKDNESILSVDGNGFAVAFAYDANGNLVQRTEYLTALATPVNPAIQPAPQSSTADRTIRYAYDKLNRLVSTTDALGGVTELTLDAVGNTLSSKDANGRITTYTYDANDRLIKAVDPLGGVRSSTYDAQGNELTSTDENGHATTYVYDAKNRLITQIEPLGGRWQYSYDARDNKLSQTDPNGHITTYSYNALDRLVQEKNALDGVTAYVYDAVGNLVSSTDALGHKTSFAYDVVNRLVTRTDALGGVRTTTYDAVGNRTSETDEAGRVTRLTYDVNNHLITIRGALGGVKFLSYDAVGQQLSETDQNGHRITYTYDANGRVITQTDATGVATRFTYDKVGNRLTLTNGNGAVTSYAYDANNRLMRETDALGIDTLFSYDAVGNLLQRVRAANTPDRRVEAFTYDTLDRQTSATDALGGVTRYSYDAVGNRILTIDALGNGLAQVFDANNRLIRENNALGIDTVFVYDAVGNLLQRVHAANKGERSVEEFTYDALDRQSSLKDPLGGVTSYTYDAAGNHLTETDQKSHTVSFTYDAENHQLTRTDALGGVKRYTYDLKGNELSETDERGNTYNTVYDANDRVLRRVDPLLGALAFTYDAVGNLLSRTDERGNIARYAYDAQRRLLSETDPLLNVTRYSYDAVGNRLGVTDARGYVTTYAYDKNDRLTAKTDALGGFEISTYDAVGNRLSLSDANGGVTRFEYDTLYRLTKYTDALGGVTSYSYDALGNGTLTIDALGNGLARVYDANNRVIRQNNALGINTLFTYDAAGNLLTRVDENLHTTTYAYDANDRLISTGDALGGIERYAYDAAGNRTGITDENGKTTVYAYDKLNRLASRTDALGGVASFEYDAAGNRTRAIDERGNATTFTYDADNRLLKQTDPLGAARSYSYDKTGNQATVTSQNGGVTTSTYDALNRVIKVVDALGYNTDYRYDKVGNAIEVKQQLDLANAANVAITRNAYDALNRQVSMLSAQGYLKAFQYDKLGNRIALDEYDGVFAPTAQGTAPTVGTGSKRTSRSSYDALGRLLSETSPNGVITAYEYDNVGNRTSKVEASGTAVARRTQTRYDAANRVSDVIDALGVVTHTVRDAAGNALLVQEAFGATLVRSTSYTHDANNRVTRQVDALGNITDLSYDASGNLTQRISAVGAAEQRIEKFEYDADGRQTAQINGAGDRTEYKYDGGGNRIRVTLAPGLTEQRVNGFRYDLDNRLIGESDGLGVETQHRYDGAGNRLQTIQLAALVALPGGIDPPIPPGGLASRTTSMSYDVDNRLIAVTDPIGGVTRFQYDAAGNQTRITDAKGNLTDNVFDLMGRITRSTQLGGDHGGAVVTNQYDLFGNTVQTRRGFVDNTDLRQTTYNYDKLDRQTTVTEYERVGLFTSDAATPFQQAFSTTFAYDAFGNQTNMTRGVYLLNPGDAGYVAATAARAKPLVATFAYDKADRLISTTDGVGNKITYRYDAHGNRIYQATGPAGTGEERAIALSYDKAGRLLTRLTGTGARLTFQYDKAGNQITKTLSGPDTQARTTQYSYNANGNLTAEVDPLGTRTLHNLDNFGNETGTIFAAGTTDQRSLRFEFNANDDLLAEIDAAGNRTNYVVDALGNRIQKSDALGRVTRYYYDARNQQTGVFDPESFLTTFVRDSASNVVQTNVWMTRLHATADSLVAPLPAAGAAARSTNAEYDGAGNLTREVGPDGRVKEFVRDSTGKLTQLTDRGSPDVAAVARTADKAPRVQKFEYDAAGHLVKFIDAAGRVEVYEYDTASNRTASYRRDPVTSAVSSKVTSTYDADNRLATQVVDSGGLTITEALQYDAAGNVIRKTDARGFVTTSVYDLADRLISVTDPLNSITRYGYDRVGNQVILTNARGFTTNLEYDQNNQLVREILPQVTVSEWDINTGAGVSNPVRRPTTVTRYDAVGNVVQITDPRGFRTTRYYDGNNNIAAEINADNVLRTYAYDAVGSQIGATLYMTRVTSAAVDPVQFPLLPPGEARGITSVFDAEARVLRTIYPNAEITTLANTAGSNPTATTQIRRPEETHLYDAFGNQVESTDSNGNRSLAYFDKLGRAVATVDAEGYLVETDYDGQGRVSQQRKYATPLSNVALLSAGQRPTPPTGPVATVDRSYDQAGRLIEEISPFVQLDLGDTSRVITRFAYDKAGNLIREVFAAGTAEQATEYSYYDAANRKVAVINPQRTLHLYGYDANGNQTSFTRYYNPTDTVSLSVFDPETATLARVLAFAQQTLADSSKDEATSVAFDALDRQITLTDLMAPGSADDITTTSAYDTSGNLAFRLDARQGLNGQTFTIYDGLGHAIEVLSPDGSRSFIAYDAAGLKTRSWIGGFAQVAQPATDVNAEVGDSLTIRWRQTLYGGQTGFVSYGTVPRNDVFYPNSSAQISGTAEAIASLPLTNFAAGTVIYFRVVTQTGLGTNKAWTEERSITVPPRISSLEVAKSGATLANLVVTARFSGSVTNPTLRFGPTGSGLDNATAFVQQPDGSYQATLLTPSFAEELAYQVSFAFAGTAYTTRAIPFKAATSSAVFVGAVDAAARVVSAPLSRTASAGASLFSSGLAIDPYLAEIEHNALGAKIASNDVDGLWRRFGVDANGNALKTTTVGTPQNELLGGKAIVKYTLFDRRGLRIADFDYLAAVGAPVNGAVARPVTRFAYDFASRLTRETDPVGAVTTSQYDLAGNLIRETDALGFATAIAYDRRGREVSRTDARGNTRRKQYDLGGRLIREIDALGARVQYSYDAFDRVVTTLDARNNGSLFSYDQHDNLVRVTDALGGVTNYQYDKVDRRTWVRDANGNFFGAGYDAMGRITARYSWQTGTVSSFQDAINAVAANSADVVKESTAYDIYGNKVSETDGAGRARTFRYGAFGRLLETVDGGGVHNAFEYDVLGRLTRETNTNGKDIRRTYDDAGRVLKVDDVLTSTPASNPAEVYQYDLAGRRTKEDISYIASEFPAFPPTNLSRRMTYDALGRMTQWTDAVLNKSIAYEYDAVGNRVRVSAAPNAGADHRYAFDANNRVIAWDDSGATTQTAYRYHYTYDAVGNKTSDSNKNPDGVVFSATFNYDAINRIISATSRLPDLSTATWNYDKVGNVLKYEERKSDGSIVYQTANQYSRNYLTTLAGVYNNRNSASFSSVSTTTAFDKSGRPLTEVVTDASDSADIKTTTFTHNYNARGFETSTTASGSGQASGNSRFTYDKSDRLTILEQGQSNSQVVPEVKVFSYSADGRIVRRFVNDGLAATFDTTTNYLYANGNPVGEAGNDAKTNAATFVWDASSSGNYSQIQNIGDAFPSATVSSYTVQAGDTLQIVAARVYGDSSLWFLIADANGLTGSEQLKEGSRLVIPTTTQIGRLDSQSHVLYKESAIQGSKLPNFTTVAPEQDKCAQIGAIILVVLVAIVAVVLTIVTAGAAAPAAAAALGFAATSVAGIIIGVAVGAVIGAAIGFVASAISQGIQIGLAGQKEFDWKQVAADIAVGAFGGIGGAVGAIVKIGVNAAKLARVIATGVETALDVAGEVVGQAIVGEGRIEQPWMIGVAALGGPLGELAEVGGSRALRAVAKTSAGKKVASVFGRGAAAADDAGEIIEPTIKSVRFADSASIIPGRRAIQGTDRLPGSVKGADTQFNINGANQSLSVRDPGEIFRAGGKRFGSQPSGWQDTAAQLLSSVQSPTKLDYSASTASLKAVRLMLSGQVAKFTREAIRDFMLGSVGRVTNRQIPIGQIAGLDSVLAKKALIDVPRIEPSRIDIAATPVVPAKRDLTDAERAAQEEKLATTEKMLKQQATAKVQERIKDAALLAQNAAQAESAVTQKLVSLADELGGDIRGLDRATQKVANNLKTESSLLQKLRDTPKAEVYDALRYTITFEGNELGVKTNQTLQDLAKNGFEVLRVKNTFKDDATYRGINTVLRAPAVLDAQGKVVSKPQFFELQFHTPESFVKNKQTHGLYEVKRALDPSASDFAQRRAYYDEETRKIASQIDNPPGILNQVKAFDAVDEVLGPARLAEPKITRDIEALTELTGGKNIGLEYRLKEPKSLKQKLGDTPANQTYDNVRYTIAYDDYTGLGDGYGTVRKQLEDKGYELFRVKNSFVEGANYKAVNSVFKSPEGQYFEVQFHTEYGFWTNKKSHDLYEQKRQLPAGTDEYNRLHNESQLIAAQIPTPSFLQDRIKNVVPSGDVRTNVKDYFDILTRRP